MKRLRLGETLSRQAAENMADDMWLGGSEPDSEKGQLALRMMEKRMEVLTNSAAEFCKLATELGWGADTVVKSGAALMPYFDVAERACYTYYGHQYRSMQYAEIVLDSRGVHGEERPAILLGVLLHDLGKVGVPGTILRKVGIPETSEAKLIRKHTEYSRRIIAKVIREVSVKESLVWTQGQTIAAIVFAHHEQFSGAGYPLGVAGEAIDLGARIAGLCDSIDAMSSKRIYRPIPSATFAEVEARARKEMDGQFNQNLVTNFLDAAKCPAVLERIFAIIRSAGGIP